MFTSTQNKGFRMKFENNFSISVQWGSGNYCSNRDKKINEKSENFIESFTAEVAIFFDDKLLPITNNEVIGWLTAGDVANIIEIVSKAHNKKELVESLEKIW